MDGTEIYLNRIKNNEKTDDEQCEITNMNQTEARQTMLLNRYVYPTTIILPIIIALVIIIVSTANFLTKFMVILLLLFSLFFYVVQLRNVNIVKLCKEKFMQLKNRKNPPAAEIPLKPNANLPVGLTRKLPEEV